MLECLLLIYFAPLRMFCFVDPCTIPKPMCLFWQIGEALSIIYQIVVIIALRECNHFWGSTRKS